MPQSSNIGTYGDIKQQLSEIRAMGGAKVNFATFGQACVWVARVYKFRALLRNDIKAATNIPGFSPSTPWDDLLMRHDKPNRTTFVTVEFGAKIFGKLTPLKDEERQATPLTHQLAESDFLPLDPATENLLDLAEKLKGQS